MCAQQEEEEEEEDKSPNRASRWRKPTKKEATRDIRKKEEEEKEGISILDGQQRKRRGRGRPPPAGLGDPQQSFRQGHCLLSHNIRKLPSVCLSIIVTTRRFLVSLIAQVLIVDSRSFLEYNDLHIQGAVNVCCSKLVKRRLQQDKVISSAGQCAILYYSAEFGSAPFMYEFQIPLPLDGPASTPSNVSFILFKGLRQRFPLAKLPFRARAGRREW